MKANEFRIGNLISDGFFIYKILEISKGIVKGFSTQNGEFFYPDTLYSLNEENLEGIPLTEEWLLKFGFITHDNHDYFIDISSVCDIHSWFSVFKADDFYYIDVFDIKIRYVHQLQNLYFALTGEELEIIK